jgi:hypothetical protein
LEHLPFYAPGSEETLSLRLIPGALRTMADIDITKRRKDAPFLCHR